MSDNDIKPVAWAKPADVECLAFEDGNSYPGIRRHEDESHIVALYGQSAIDRLKAERDAAVADSEWYRWLFQRIAAIAQEQING